MVNNLLKIKYDNISNSNDKINNDKPPPPPNKTTK